MVSGTLAASRLHGLPHEVMDAAETMRRFPAFKIPDDYVGVFQPDGGFIAAEAAIAAMLAQARAAGAEIQTERRACIPSTPHGNGVRVETSAGDIDARTAIVAAGPWLKTAPARSAGAASRHPRGDGAGSSRATRRRSRPDRFPVFLLESRTASTTASRHARGGARQGRQASPPRRDGRSRTTSTASVSADDEALIRAAVRRPHPGGRTARSRPAKTCLYTMTPDRDFLIDRLPGAPNIIVASPCSGHGFKFAPVIGEILADLATEGGTGHDISRFRFGRFG